jgi:hypothetical protein
MGARSDIRITGITSSGSENATEEFRHHVPLEDCNGSLSVEHSGILNAWTKKRPEFARASLCAVLLLGRVLA